MAYWLQHWKQRQSGASFFHHRLFDIAHCSNRCGTAVMFVPARLPSESWLPESNTKLSTVKFCFHCAALIEYKECHSSVFLPWQLSGLTERLHRQISRRRSHWHLVSLVSLFSSCSIESANFSLYVSPLFTTFVRYFRGSKIDLR